ncbi:MULTISPECIES: oligopeptide ABC transporter permease [Fictibacillus]|uniref:Peptide ABC transporter permease n=1 Tax=Fictibacillus enclensis TaxID=1017270 RepID=A0A0V8JD40_9BACL|nr:MULTISPECIES: oligopeptide ABC transporter permease [Fictibacillus]KSU84849.1 peptide ABC transporter permease [Fictibacillus enclensis]RXY99494.1 ABC transporter permease [Fictibacillus sp. S7]SCB86782.1 oligopeptide transport system permease protein [Fictibacillus enclensis]
MARFVLKRLLYMLITLFIITSFTFFLMKLLPGSPFNNEEKLTDQQKFILNEKYGLNDPVPVQYFNYMGNLVKGDMGVSFQYDNRPVSTMIAERIGPSAVLGVEATIIGTIIGLILGIAAALKHNTSIDYLSSLIAVLGISIPSFVFAGVLQYYVGVKLEWLPVALWDGPKYHVLPALSLSVFVIATVARFMRTEMLEVLGQDYITTAKSKGLSNLVVIWKHTIRNALIPVVTILGPLAINLITGTLIIEKIFAVPGLGFQFVSSITLNDYPVIMATTIFYSVCFIIVILIVDILYGVIDPRIRVAGGKG